MSLNLLTYDPETRTGMFHDTEHEMSRDFFYAFDAGDSKAMDATAPDVSHWLIPHFGYAACMDPLVSMAYRRVSSH